jgi:hypothetical protein
MPQANRVERRRNQVIAPYNWNRRHLAVAERSGEGPFTTPLQTPANA